MNTYQKTFIICPHCETKTNSSIDHLEQGESFGPWYCDDCGSSFVGTADGTETRVEKHKHRFTRTLDLLVLEPQENPVYFVISGNSFDFGDKDHDEDAHKRYVYDEHSCPTNWIGETRVISIDGDTDPHGLFKFVRHVEVGEKISIEYVDQHVEQLFHEVKI